ncbi:DciA family protein [Streptomyces sp. NPDC020681]|uniref:DciA family protein n=1 Tax=Streptomyces sp. NPDC020681 TaxID=3365083 RepID=UPI003792C402
MRRHPDEGQRDPATGPWRTPSGSVTGRPGGLRRFGSKFAARVEPLGLDARMRLHVLCENTAYRTLMQLMQGAVATRINEIVPQAQLTGLLASVRPTIVVLVVATDDFADEQLVADVLLTPTDCSGSTSPREQTSARSARPT